MDSGKASSQQPNSDTSGTEASGQAQEPQSAARKAPRSNRSGRPSGDLPISNTHASSPAQVASALDSNPVSGLAREEAADRLGRFGTNSLPTANPTGALRLLERQFRSFLVIILVAAAALNLGVWLHESRPGFPYDTIVILAIVIANAGLGFAQEYRAERSLQELRELSGPAAVVTRGGRRFRVPAADLVPGDLVQLRAGNRVPADARLVEAASLEIDESALTGESVAVLKSTAAVVENTPLADRTDMAYAGTVVAGGRGAALVTATAEKTEVGRIAALLRQEKPGTTPLQQSLDRLGRRMGLLVIAIAAVVTATGLLVTGPLTSATVVNMLLFGVALAVAAIPEGLPGAVTAALALGTQRMARRNAIVRRLPAVETLGCTTAICSDKTGTLTVGEMTARRIEVPAGSVKLSGSGYDPEGEVEGSDKAIRQAARLAVTACLCNDSSIRRTKEGRWLAVGMPTEAALLAMASKLGIDYDQLRRQNARLAEEPFSSERRRMSVANSAGGGLWVMHAKGAPEALLPLCSRVEDGAGRPQPLSDERRLHYLQTAERLARRGLRTIAFARRETEPGECGDLEQCEREMTFLGLAGIDDPPRPEAAASVSACRMAGIRVYMVTGDHQATAQAVAAELGMETGAMTGPEIDAASDEQLVQQLDNVHIFARVSPGHKVRIVRALQSLGHTVAVTGDGINDAPALKQADIGVSMGRGGTDVAREAADMVLADDDFSTIVAAVEEGRAIFANIRKFVAYLLSSNAGEVLTLFAGVLLAGSLGLRDADRLLLPLLAVQILWINLVTDGLPALALGVDPRDPQAMARPPRPRGEPVINRRAWALAGIVGIVSAGCTLLLLYAYYQGGPIDVFSGHSVDYARTVAFVTLALIQIFNSFNCRRLQSSSLRHLTGNRWLLGAAAVSVVLMLLVTELPALQRAFQTAALAPADWLICAAVASAALWAVELYKLAAGFRDRPVGASPLR